MVFDNCIEESKCEVIGYLVFLDEVAGKITIKQELRKIVQKIRFCK